MRIDRTTAQALADIGHEPMSEKTTMRSTRSFRDRMTRAAEECGMTESEWLRVVATSAVELHEARENAVAAGIDFDDLELVGDEEEPTFDDPDYAAKVEEAAAAERRKLARPSRAPREEPQERMNPRECPHRLSARMGPRCSDCGLTVGQVVRRNTGATGRYLGTVR